MQRLRISYKRARDYLHSPDVHYQEKMTEIEACLALARAEPERYTFLYLDEMSFYRHPTLSWDYAPTGSTLPLAQRSHRSNTSARILGAMNAITGQVTYFIRSATPMATFRMFYHHVHSLYPQAERIFIAQDNWPLHDHPDVTVILEEQEFTWRPNKPANWPSEPRSALKPADLPIQLLFVPTYAPWTNPIEKLWRWLRQEILHLHRQSDDWPQLKDRVGKFLDQFSGLSPQLLRYTGLLPN